MRAGILLRLTHIAHTAAHQQQAIMLNNFDFTFKGTPEDVGMQTGATIHTMNGLNMYVRKRTDDDAPLVSEGWWEQQHLSRGLRADGKPYNSEEDAVWEKTSTHAAGGESSSGSTGKCPF